jgi:hypothetical protein
MNLPSPAEIILFASDLYALKKFFSVIGVSYGFHFLLLVESPSEFAFSSGAFLLMTSIFYGIFIFSFFYLGAVVLV